VQTTSVHRHNVRKAHELRGRPRDARQHFFFRRSAEGDAAAEQIQVTGYRTLAEFERHTAAANQPRLALQAFEKQAANKDWQTAASDIGKPKN
jgi:hypothetical protein